MAKPNKGVRSKAFREQIAKQLDSYGFANSYTWSQGPSRLVLVVKGSLRELPLHAGMSRTRLAFELGRIAGWGEMLRAA